MFSVSMSATKHGKQGKRFRRNYNFSYPKYFRYEDPKLSFSINNDEITVTANAYAKSVEIQNENQDLVLSDNYFDLNSNSRTVKILRGNSTGIRVRSVYQIR